ncbi:hypothetical protein EIO60_02074|nr:hypothetical protein [Candidatus Pantoea persica]
MTPQSLNKRKLISRNFQLKKKLYMVSIICQYFKFKV